LRSPLRRRLQRSQHMAEVLRPPGFAPSTMLSASSASCSTVGLCRPRRLDLQQLLESLGVSPLAPPAVLEVVRQAHEMSYPPHWSEELDAVSGGIYFYNELRDSSSWQHPLTETFLEVVELVSRAVAGRPALDALVASVEGALAEVQQRAAQELSDWMGPLVGGTDGSVFFHNSRTGESTWEDPCERFRYDLQVRHSLLVAFLDSALDEASAEAEAATESEDLPAGACRAWPLPPRLVSSTNAREVGKEREIRAMPLHQQDMQRHVGWRWSQQRGIGASAAVPGTGIISGGCGLRASAWAGGLDLEDGLPSESSVCIV